MLALVTARGGSKAIPGKNIKLLAGKPLIAWTIEAAKKAESVDRVVVSTDDELIATIAKEWGADVPFLRPSELAQDNSPSIDAVTHAVKWLAENENYQPEYVMLLQPTSPLRSARDIENVIEFAKSRQAESVVSVTPADHNPYWMKKISTEGRLENFMPDSISFSRRQDLPAVYMLNGSIYLVKRDILLTRNSLYTENTLAYVMPTERSMDIDTPWELYLAELILEDRLRNERI